MTLEELAKITRTALKGDGALEIGRLKDLDRLAPGEVPGTGDLYFVETKKALRKRPRVVENGAVLTPESLAGEFQNALVAPDKEIRLAFIRLLEHFADFPAYPAGVSQDGPVHPKAKAAPSAAILPGAVVMEGAEIGGDCRIMPGAVVEPFARVGEGTVLHPNAVVGHHCQVGERCVIHAGTVIGSDGFGFHDQDGKRYKIPQIGTVIVHDDVELGSNCTIDRAAIATTEIGAMTKFDNQVHVAHNCLVGRSCYIAAGTTLGGGVVVEDGVMMSGECVVNPQTRIAKGTILMGNTAVAQDTEPGQAYFGTPARPAREMHKVNSVLGRLPELLRRVKKLEGSIPSGTVSV